MRLVLCDDDRILCGALTVALQARGHQAPTIARTADGRVAVIAREPGARLMGDRFPDEGAP